jgi:hypothetical protein
MEVVLAGVVVDAEIRFDDSPVLFEIIARLLLETAGERLAEEQGDADQQESEYQCVDGGEGKTKASSNVLALGQLGLRRLLYNGLDEEIGARDSRVS